jgi:alpha-N-arabinofuranosidase
MKRKPYMKMFDRSLRDPAGKRALIFLILYLLAFPACCGASECLVTVKDTGDNRVINDKVFGNNFLGYDPRTYEKDIDHDYYGYSDFGAGLWDYQRRAFAPELVGMARKIRISSARFPGGAGANKYDWKGSFLSGRKLFRFGILEFLNLCELLGAEPVYTLSYDLGDEQDAADLVEFLTADHDANNDNSWAAKRFNAGRKRPYKIKYFEFGNEIYLRAGPALPLEYANRYLRYYRKIKKTNGSALLGAVLDNPVWDLGVLSVIKNEIDFGILHLYPSPYLGEELENKEPGEVFEKALNKNIGYVEDNIRRTRSELKIFCGKDVPIAVTEFNGNFINQKPAPYRHSLGNALINAELLRVFMKPEHNIIMANNWNFCNEYWGMVANGFDGTAATLYNPYFKRPNYCVFELYRNHFGNILLSGEVSVLPGNGVLPDASGLSVNASKTSDGKKIFLMVVNKDMNLPVTAKIDLKDFASASEGDAWVLNGPGVDATNEVKHDNVKVEHQTFKIDNGPFEFTFEPHSLTAIEIKRKTGEPL